MLYCFHASMVSRSRTFVLRRSQTPVLSYSHDLMFLCYSRALVLACCHPFADYIVNCKPFGAPADPTTITPLRIKDLVFGMGDGDGMEIEMETEMEVAIFGGPMASWEVSFGALMAS